jgi:hypothetical protein
MGIGCMPVTLTFSILPKLEWDPIYSDLFRATYKTACSNHTDGRCQGLSLRALSPVLKTGAQGTRVDSGRFRDC